MPAPPFSSGLVNTALTTWHAFLQGLLPEFLSHLGEVMADGKTLTRLGRRA